MAQIPPIVEPICNFTTAPPGNVVPRKGRCIACMSRSAAHSRCTGISTTQGCKDCSEWGIPCIRGDWALPPHPERRTGASLSPGWIRCTVCPTQEECDRGHPCMRCIDRNQPALCERATWRSILYRPVPGDDMYGFWISKWILPPLLLSLFNSCF